MASPEFTPGLILKVTNIGVLGMNEDEFDRDFHPASNEIKDERVTREILKEVFEKYGYIKHVDYFAGKSEGTVRFSDRDTDPNVCSKIIEDFAETPLVLGGQEVKLELVSGDEEEAIYKSIFERGQNRTRDGGDRRGGFGGDRRGGYGGDRRGGYSGDRRGGYSGDRNGGDDRRRDFRGDDRRPRYDRRGDDEGQDEKRDYQ